MSNTPTTERSSSPISRRTALAGAGTVGALAAAAAVLPLGQAGPQQVTAAPRQEPSSGGGYQLTEHVKRYYQTARV